MTFKSKRNPVSNILFEVFVRPVTRLQRYRMSFEGYAFICLMGMIGFAAWHSGANLLYLMFAMMIGFFLVQGMLVWTCLLRLDVTRKLPRTATALEEIEAKLLVNNRKPVLNSYGLRIVDYLEKDQALGAAFVVSVRHGSALETVYRAVFPQRGLCTLKRMIISTRYPFGLVQRSMLLKQKDHVLVYPQQSDVSAVLADLRVDFGEHESRKKGPGSDLYGLKEYTVGDHVRHIHWRSSAKAQRLMTMEYERDERQRITIVLRNIVEPNLVKNSKMLEDFERAVIFAANLSRKAAAAGYEVQMLTDSGAVPFGQGVSHLHRLLRACALLQLATSGSPVSVSPEAASVIVQVTFQDGKRVPGAQLVDVRDWRISAGKFVPRSSVAA